MNKLFRCSQTKWKCCCFDQCCRRRNKSKRGTSRSDSVTFNPNSTNNHYLSMTVEASNTSESSSSSTTSSSSSPQLTSVSSGSGEASANGSAPSAPSPGVILYKSEERCDLSFTVSPDANETDGWRFPAHSFIVENASPVFKRIIEEHRSQISSPTAPPPKILVQSNPKIFDLMMSFVYKRELSLNSVANSLDLYALSNKFEVHELSEHCLTFIYSFVSLYNVLPVLSFLRKETKNRRPDAASVRNENILNELINKCFNILDENADTILHSEELESLEQSLLIEILTRDSLKLVNESTAFSAINRWANEHCLKQQLELVADNKRTVLGEALFCVRYLVMNIDEFLKGPFVSDLLTDREKNCFMAKLKGSNIELPPCLKNKKLDVKRNFVKPSALVSPSRRSGLSDSDAAVTPDSRRESQQSAMALQNNGVVASTKNKKSISKKIARGMSEFLICAIQLID